MAQWTPPEAEEKRLKAFKFSVMVSGEKRQWLSVEKGECGCVASVRRSLDALQGAAQQVLALVWKGKEWWRREIPHCSAPGQDYCTDLFAGGARGGGGLLGEKWAGELVWFRDSRWLSRVPLPGLPLALTSPPCMGTCKRGKVQVQVGFWGPKGEPSSHTPATHNPILLLPPNEGECLRARPRCMPPAA